jgi:hypothetical protein
MIFLIVLIFSTVAVFQIPPLVKQKYWRELAVFSILHATALVLSLLYVSGVPIPSPMPFLKYVIQDVLHIKYPK